MRYYRHLLFCSYQNIGCELIAAKKHLMQANQATVSGSFKAMTVKAIFAIVLFIITYLVLITLAVALTVLCGYAGLWIIIRNPGTLTILLGAGLAGTGVLILIFLIKFIFARNKVDSSHLIEITKQNEPKLFQMIEEIVAEVKTSFPKRIYLSSNVNAAVFYNSSFWSMFLPIRKNLEIGIGLVNSISKEEFKAILAHEFGHFSQRSMKVGSFVYNVNKILHNMLFNNNGYISLAQGFANVHGLLYVFAKLAVGITGGIQWILGKVYMLVNLSYLGLSREMEFHADEVAARVAGSKPMISGLMRLDLADQSFNIILEHYGKKIADSVKTGNIYPQQKFVMNFLAAENKLPVIDGLPQVTMDFNEKYNKSKLTIKDQWASHPTTTERVAAIQNLALKDEPTSGDSASVMFADFEATQKAVSEKLFSGVTYEATPVDETPEAFSKSYKANYLSVSFHDVFNSYYDNKKPVVRPQVVLSQLGTPGSKDQLFDSDAVGMVYSLIAMEADLATIKNINSGVYAIKTFDYDGVKYKAKKAGSLIEIVESDISVLKQKIDEHDAVIFSHLTLLAKQTMQTEKFQSEIIAFEEMEKDYDSKIELHSRLVEKVAFLSEDSTLEAITTNLEVLEVIEAEFKTVIKEILEGNKYQSSLLPECRTAFTKLLEVSKPYFSGHSYNNEVVQTLYGAIHSFQSFLFTYYINGKRALLDFEASMLESKMAVAN